MTSPTIVLVTDPRWSAQHVDRTVEVVAQALAPRALLVQLRDKAATMGDLASAAGRLREVTARAGARLVINAPAPDACAVAVRTGADGVHVPCNREAIAGARRVVGEHVWISTPAHSDDDVTIAASAGVSAVLVSPIWESPGKGSGRGVDALRAARALAPGLLVYALGGVDPSRAKDCAEAGADGVAVMRALFDAPRADLTTAAARLDAPFREITRRSAADRP